MHRTLIASSSGCSLSSHMLSTHSRLSLVLHSCAEASHKGKLTCLRVGCMGDLLMPHCHPLFMVQSIYQPPDKQLAGQAHSPEVLVVLAKIQQHPNSQQQGKKPLQSLVALVLTHDNLFVGANIGPKVSEGHSCCLSFIGLPLQLCCKLSFSALRCSNDACFPGCVSNHQGSWPVGCELPITREHYGVGCSAGV